MRLVFEYFDSDWNALVHRLFEEVGQSLFDIRALDLVTLNRRIASVLKIQILISVAQYL